MWKAPSTVPGTHQALGKLFSLCPTDTMSPSPGPGEKVCKARSCSPGSRLQKSSFAVAVSTADPGSALQKTGGDKRDKRSHTAPGPGPARLHPGAGFPGAGAQPPRSNTPTSVSPLLRLLWAPMWREQLCH